MKNWNDELARQQRHILLLIDNAPSHIVDEYSNIKIQFLPPNTTSKIQPLDQGIIRSVKCAYRKTIQVQYCSCVENYEEVKRIMQSFDFVVAVNTLVDAWEGVKPELSRPASTQLVSRLTYLHHQSPLGTSGRECRIYLM